MDKMCERDWRIFREDNDIQIKGGNYGVKPCPNPLRMWKEISNIARPLLENIRDMDFERPMPI